MYRRQTGYLEDMLLQAFLVYDCLHLLLPAKCLLYGLGQGAEEQWKRIVLGGGRGGKSKGKSIGNGWLMGRDDR